MAVGPKIKQKGDRRDALKAAQLSAVNQLRPVHVPRAARELAPTY